MLLKGSNMLSRTARISIATIRVRTHPPAGSDRLRGRTRRPSGARRGVSGGLCRPPGGPGAGALLSVLAL